MTAVTFEQTRPADYLTRLAQSDLGRAYKSVTLAELGIAPGHTVLDLGCGPGTDLPAFAAAAGPDGTVIGLDHDEDQVAQARDLAATVPRVRVESGDAHATGLADGSVDRLHTDRVLQHVADPAAVLVETRRLLRPGGRAVLAEPDWDALVIDYPDPEVALSYRRFITERAVRNARIGRQLPRLAQEAGLTVTRVIPGTAVFRDAAQADQVLGFQRVTARAIAAGYLSAAEANEWLHHLRTRPFFAAATLFITVVVPAG